MARSEEMPGAMLNPPGTRTTAQRRNIPRRVSNASSSAARLRRIVEDNSVTPDILPLSLLRSHPPTP